MDRTARVVTTLVENKCIYRVPESQALTGICADLWNKTASNLNLTFTVDIVDDWWEQFTYYSNNLTDVIMERVDDAQMIHSNITE